ncbi:hypothetical protein [Oceanobacillus kimchii]|uniref:Uncharacterized protein n=1 Tax=Oceanobacillus kimchii TaxID=746691 RepID=A0ABQ5THC6_9BACI|nr:hypothetical protein [Oceanobacillus kimchii]GLO66273.1 hypothetical protein MACH08_20570 [Oceanobacillus kimchii]
MTKYDYVVKEILTFQRHIEIESDLEESELYNILDDAERYCDTADDVSDYLEDAGVKVLERPDSDTDSPTFMEVEEFDIRKIK